MPALSKSKRFNAELRRAFRHGLSLDDWGHLEYLFEKGEPLPEEYDEHRLTGNWEGFWDCHLEGDLVVIYKRTAKKNRFGQNRHPYGDFPSPQETRLVGVAGGELKPGVRFIYVN